ncbi:hypothetical protein [Bradyrhizobium sp. USDA 10063]
MVLPILGAIGGVAMLPEVVKGFTSFEKSIAEMLHATRQIQNEGQKLKHEKNDPADQVR